MKTIRVLTAIILAVWACGFTGCANESRSTTTSASNATAGQRTYSSEDLNRTGKRTPSEQVQAVDPSVTASGGH